MTNESLYKYLAGEELHSKTLREIENTVIGNPELMQAAESYIMKNQNLEWEFDIEQGIREYEKIQYRKQLQKFHADFEDEIKNSSISKLRDEG